MNRNCSIDIVIPVYNEGKVLRCSIDTLRKFFNERIIFTWKIIIADNGSQDNTRVISEELCKTDSRISYLFIEEKGRGKALKKAWMESNADIVSYMDVDLSTNLIYFPLLVEGLKCGYDVAIGSRLMQASRIKRCIKREFISRSYNLLIKSLFFNRFSDAQCGFKAFKRKVAQRLVPMIKNDNWFFDTELLLWAEHFGYRIFEVPVEWIEDLETKVKISKTAIEDAKGLLRMRFTLWKTKTVAPLV